MIRLDQFRLENYDSLISWILSEEELMQFGGPLFHFPLTAEQLDTSLNDKNRISFVVIDEETNIPVGHSEIFLSENSAKLGRILIGEKSMRGKGLGQEIVQKLLDFTFSKLNRHIADLNVFDWNTSAIKCYEKVGFKINPDIKLERRVKDQTWIAINMTITKEIYEQTMERKKNLS